LQNNENSKKKREKRERRREKKKKGRHTFASYTNAAHLKDFAGRNPTQQQKNRVLPLEAHARTIRAQHKTSTH
jgi:hypothetical protein